jgi:hypothetical protein
MTEDRIGMTEDRIGMTGDRIGMTDPMMSVRANAAPLRAAVIVDTDSGAGFVLYLNNVEKPFFLDLHESVRESSPRRRPRT